MRARIENDIQKFMSGRISRRTLMTRAAAAGAVASLPIGILAHEAKAATPKRGGHFRLGSSHGSTTDVLDTTKLTSGFTQMLHYTHLSQLTEVDADGNIQPLLAESFESNADATEWVFNLRKGAEFRNGKTLNADDVVMSIARHQGETSESPTKSVAEEISEMRKDGKNQVTFKLKAANVDFPYSLSASTFGIHPVVDGEVNVDVGGTGAYVITDFEPGVITKLKRFENYFFDDRGYFDTIEAITMHDSMARQNAIQSGEVDYIDEVNPRIVDRVGKLSGVKVSEVTGTQHFLFAMNTTMAPFDNNDVRLALKYSIDREAVLKNVLNGHGSLGNDNPISTNDRFHAVDLPQTQYDPDKARFHLKKAGVSDLSVELSATNGLYEGAMDSALLFQEHAKKADINVMPKQVPADGYWSDIWMKAPFCASFWSGRPTADWMFSQGYSTQSTWNETYWDNARFEELLTAARGEQDVAVRAEMYNEMQHLVHDDGGSLIFLYANHIAAHSDKLAHPEKVAGNWELDGFKIMERWWFA